MNVKRVILSITESDAVTLELLRAAGRDLCVKRYIELLAFDHFLGVCDSANAAFTDALNYDNCELEPEPSTLILTSDGMKVGDIGSVVINGRIHNELEIDVYFEN